MSNKELLEHIKIIDGRISLIITSAVDVADQLDIILKEIRTVEASETDQQTGIDICISKESKENLNGCVLG